MYVDVIHVTAGIFRTLWFTLSITFISCDIYNSYNTIHVMFTEKLQQYWKRGTATDRTSIATRTNA